MEASQSWQERAVAYARIMSRVTWTPVADGMPIKGRGHFEKGTEYTGVPYSSVKWAGRYIGFDIFLKTFLAAVENPESVVYTEDLSGKVSNAGCYYGKVCSSFTSYALQCGVWYVSRLYLPPYREGITLVAPQSAQAAAVGDVIYTPPAAGSHVELVTGITRGDDGTVTHVLVEESRPATTRTSNHSAADFDAHISAKGRQLYRITDFDAWRGENRAESFLFPDYDEDSRPPVINRVLLLDRGDWVPYHRQEPVRINVMDRDSQGVQRLVVKRGSQVMEEIPVAGRGIIERTFPTCGDYAVHAVLADGSPSQACEFAVCDLAFAEIPERVHLKQPWKLGFRAENMTVILVYLNSARNDHGRYIVTVGEQDRRNGWVPIPPDLLQSEDIGTLEVWLFGENRYGRLKQRCEVTVVE